MKYFRWDFSNHSGIRQSSELPMKLKGDMRNSHSTMGCRKILGPVGPRWTPCCPHEPCYRGSERGSWDVCVAACIQPINNQPCPQTSNETISKIASGWGYRLHGVCRFKSLQGTEISIAFADNMGSLLYLLLFSIYHFRCLIAYRHHSK